LKAFESLGGTFLVETLRPSFGILDKHLDELASRAGCWNACLKQRTTLFVAANDDLLKHRERAPAEPGFKCTTEANSFGSDLAQSNWATGGQELLRSLGRGSARSTNEDKEEKRAHHCLHVRPNVGVDRHARARRRDTYDPAHGSRRLAGACPRRTTC
jgi:hypothetical protein